ncbi:MAG: RNB domain-containing ribonuclease, partial [Proteobacteria bacterium]|nr:RNB domain-containing ribonuclease [Pseudomonadota bacterium]
CSVKQTELIWPGKEFSDFSSASPHLVSRAAWVVKKKEEFDLETIHELCEKSHPYSLDELGEDFLDDPSNGWEVAALLFALKENSRLFQQKKERFFARSEKEIEKIDSEELKKEQQELVALREQEWAQCLKDGVTPEIGVEEHEVWTQFVQRIKQFLIYLDESQEKDYFCKLFSLSLNSLGELEYQLLSCLKVAGSAISWGKLLLQRASVNQEFPTHEIQSVDGLKDLNIWESPFHLETRDQRDLSPVTIDSALTKDYDDAISWESKDSGLLLRVHIADVSSFIDSKHPLFTGASKRISSLYTLKRTFHMLPSVLAEDLFSLKAGTEKAVMTLEILIDETYKPMETQLYRSVIKVCKNLCYEEVDQAMEEKDPSWIFLKKFSNELKETRMTNGALDLDRKEVKLNISDPKNIVVKAIRENTPANILIQELAIYTNSIVAKRCYDDEMPALFRNQPPYKVLIDLEEGQKPKLQNLQIKPATLGITPSGHSALGLEAYLQCTSPIRRFSDLVCQAILFSLLSNMGEPYPEESLQLWAKQCELTQKLYNKVERELSDYWKFKYLQQNLNVEYECEVLRKFRSGNYQLLITDLQLQVETAHPNLALNSMLKVIVRDTNPITKTVKLDFA